MLSRNKLLFGGIVILAAFTILGCSLFTDTSVIQINLNPGPVPTDGSRSFKPDIVIGGTLTVDIPDSDRIVKSFDKNDDTIRMVVPSGKQRKIELEVNLNPDDIVNPGPVLSFIGTETVDLAPNEIKHVSLKMIPGRTKLLVPDYYGNKVLQVDSLHAAPTSPPVQLIQDMLGWPTGSPLFYPSDIDLDSRGRIYIGNGYSTPYDVIIRLDSMIDTKPEFFQCDNYVQALAVDKYNNLLYYSTGNGTFWYVDLNAPDGTIPAPVQLFPSYSYFVGIDIDRDGFVYVTGGSEPPFVLKLKPKSGEVVASFNDTTGVLSTPQDLVVKDDGVFVSNPYNSTPDTEILRLRTYDLTLDVAGSGGARDGSTLPPIRVPGTFWGTSKFIGNTTRDFFILDEMYDYNGGSPIGYNRIVSFTNPSGSGWATREEANDGLKLFLDSY
jgi:hypothetical protein